MISLFYGVGAVYFLIGTFTFTLISLWLLDQRKDK